MGSFSHPHILKFPQNRTHSFIHSFTFLLNSLRCLTSQAHREHMTSTTQTPGDANRCQQRSVLSPVDSLVLRKSIFSTRRRVFIALVFQRSDIPCQMFCSDSMEAARWGAVHPPRPGDFPLTTYSRRLLRSFHHREPCVKLPGLTHVRR